MSEEVVRDLVAMGKFLGSIDGIGVKRSATGKSAPVTAKARSGSPAGALAPPAGPARFGIPGPEDAPEDAPEPVSARRPKALDPSAGLDRPAAPNRPEGDAAATEQALFALREEIGDCRRCRLCEGRTKIVFGQGNPVAELMFVGEAPGADEDIQGLAFVGRAGQLLTDMVEKGMRINRADVFIANVIKCRPPGNRPPENDEVSTCQPFLEAQIRAIKPRAIVALGATAGKFMARSTDPISKLRGRFASWDGIPVMPTYHPAYLLRNPSAKKTVWEDLKLVLDLLGRSSG